MIPCRATARRLLTLCSRYAQSPQLDVVQGWQHCVRSNMTSPRDMKLLDNRVIVLTMPRLSPTMTEASLSGWAKKQGQVIDPYDLVYELETETLTEEAYRMGDFAGRIAMEIELVEDAYLARQLKQVSTQMLPVGTPIGLLCEDESDIKEVAQHKLPDDFNEYNEGTMGMYRIATWQSYLKERKVEPPGGCM